ncbi:prephenate dehydratase [soil metagenome]
MSRVAFLGPDGTFTSEAARLAAAEGQRCPLPTISDVFAAVREGDADLGVVPVENSIEGSVNLTLDELAFGPPGVRIRGEVTVAIVMNLLAKPGVELHQITAVRSQPHALAQCRQWLAAHLPGVAQQAATSTAEAALQVAEGDGTVAALGPAPAAQRFGLEVLAAGVQDHPGNQTRFLVLGRTMAARTGADKTSLVVFFGEDRPGLLLRILDEFALRGVNLTKIESRPTKQALGEYCIVIDSAGHVTDARVAGALRGVHRHAAQVRVLGAYPRADGLADDPRDHDSDGAYAAAGDWYDALLADVEGFGVTPAERR